MEASISEIENLLEELQTELGPWVEEIDKNMEKHNHKGFSKSFNKETHVAKSQISATFAFVLQTLYFTLLKVNNVDTSNHPINEEIDRIRTLYVKIDKVLNPQKYEQKNNSKPAKTNFAKRVVTNAISVNNFKDREMKRQKTTEDDVKDKSESKSKDEAGKHKISSSNYMDEDSD